MKKGDKIESDRVLASKLSVGRSAIREVLKVLEVRNLLKVRAAYLAAGCMAAKNMTISNLMRHVSGSGMVDEGQLRDIYEEHQKVYGLILAKDAKGASDAMKEHLEKSTGRYNYR